MKHLEFNLYQEKDEPGSSHSLLKYYLSNLPENTHILDVGAATGLLGKILQNTPVELFGIEPNAAWAEAARPFYKRIIVARLDEVCDDYLKNYDIVVCADVLEHMADPGAQLARLVRLQSRRVRFIVCVPNVANIWIRIQLLFGNFEYTDRGILDATHLRFFTRKSFKKFLTDSGLAIEKVIPTPIPLSLIHPFFIRTLLGRQIQNLLKILTRLFPTILGYQFFCLAFVDAIHQES